ncbi:MAG TPA: hypothetical protein DEU86_03300 [Gammaproteobacteria bacterium]|nr:hypothetical protein [Gammaproteobacteria bacterium]
MGAGLALHLIKYLFIKIPFLGIKPEFLMIFRDEKPFYTKTLMWFRLFPNFLNKSGCKWTKVV